MTSEDEDRRKAFQAWMDTFDRPDPESEPEPAPESEPDPEAIPVMELTLQDIADLFSRPGRRSPKIVPGDFYMHELLDRTHMLNVMLEQSIWNHPALAYDKDW